MAMLRQLSLAKTICYLGRSVSDRCILMNSSRANALILLLAAFWLTPSISSQTTQATQPSASATINKYFIEKAEPGSDYDTGPLHIIYSDGTEIIQTLPPLKKSTEKETAFNAVGFSQIQLADDEKTLGWTVLVENCCTSYPIPLSVVVFRSGRILHSFADRMVWDWMFLPGSKQMAVVWGTTHGPEVGHYGLYDIFTGDIVSEVWGDEDKQALKDDAPDWAKRLQEKLHGH